MSKTTFVPICMTEEFWANSQFSVVRYYGKAKIGCHEYIIVNKEGKDIFECSAEAKKAGRKKAIEPGEPADLVRTDFVKHYRRLGRDRFIELLKANLQTSDKELLKIFKETK